MHFTADFDASDREAAALLLGKLAQKLSSSLWDDVQMISLREPESGVRVGALTISGEPQAAVLCEVPNPFQPGLLCSLPQDHRQTSHQARSEHFLHKWEAV